MAAVAAAAAIRLSNIAGTHVHAIKDRFCTLPATTLDEFSTLCVHIYISLSYELHARVLCS